MAAALAAAAGVAVGAVVVAGDEPETKRPSGAPPFVVDLAVRTDPEAKVLRRAGQAFERGDRRRAARILQGRTSLQARAGSALAAWPVQTSPAGDLASESVERRRPLPSRPARYWTATRTARSRRGARPARAIPTRRRPGLTRSFRSFPPRSPTLHPEPARIAASPGWAPPSSSRRSPRTHEADVRVTLLYGLALQRLDRPISARRRMRAPPSSRPETPKRSSRTRCGSRRAPRTGVLQARPAQSAVSTRSNRALPSRRAAPVAEPSRARPPAAANGRESDEIAPGKGSKAPPRPSRRRTKAVSNDRTARTERWAGRPMAVDVHRWKTPADKLGSHKNLSEGRARGAGWCQGERQVGKPRRRRVFSRR